MAVIRNKLNQRLIIAISGRKSIDLLAKGTTDVTGKELSSPHLQSLIESGDILLLPQAPKKSDKTEEKEKLDKRVLTTGITKKKGKK